ARLSLRTDSRRPRDRQPLDLVQKRRAVELLEHGDQAGQAGLRLNGKGKAHVNRALTGDDLAARLRLPGSDVSRRKAVFAQQMAEVDLIFTPGKGVIARRARQTELPPALQLSLGGLNFAHAFFLPVHVLLKRDNVGIQVLERQQECLVEKEVHAAHNERRHETQGQRAFTFRHCRPFPDFRPPLPRRSRFRSLFVPSSSGKWRTYFSADCFSISMCAVNCCRKRLRSAPMFWPVFLGSTL